MSPLLCRRIKIATATAHPIATMAMLADRKFVLQQT